ncbi:VIT family domain-containing protein [Rutstroemia sp. NJR-2017a BVV2]|nr:VIT family domain-containing protein [Rutstroemia sp. NJR-2017a BVV2]PQE09385.1 VIT family domain-containing protein [Rutstroemia sp. NJR-2017a BVV2]
MRLDGTNTLGSQNPSDQNVMSSSSEIAGTEEESPLYESLYEAFYGSLKKTTPGKGGVFGKEQFEAHLRRVYEATVFTFDDSSLTINLASLHRIELLKLQRQLLEEALDFRYRKSVTTSTSATSHKYEFELSYLLKHKLVQALTDWEKIKACAAKGRMNDPFILTTSRLRDKNLINESLKEFFEKTSSMTSDQKADYHIPKLHQDVAQPHDKNRSSTLFGGSRTEMHRKAKFENFLQRLAMAGVGGAFLIGPMLLMVLKKTLLTTLLTTSVCVIAFGFTLAVYLDQPFNVLSGTAAYAAVLVVFVGTSGNTS